MNDGYCHNCPNPIECYMMGRCWPPHASWNPDAKIKELSGPLEDYQKSIVANLVLCADEDVMKTFMSRIRPLASESKRNADANADEQRDRSELNARDLAPPP